MTIHASGTPITIQEINAEYALGVDLSDYQGIRWYTEDAGTGLFDTANIDMNEFYSKRATSPVTPGSQTFTTSGTFTVPVYSVLTIVIKGGSGGGGGGNGNLTVGGNGTSGSSSAFGTYGTGDFGRGGQIYTIAGTDGAGTDGTPAGGAGGAGVFGASGGRGGHGGKTTITLTNPVSLGTGPAIGTTVAITVGANGTGGAPGSWLIFAPGPIGGSAGSGVNGSVGSVAISWA